ncbi:uncharacterized protein LOC120342393 [Styela clava]
MADISVSTKNDELTCAVCLKLFDSPIILPCSHSICKSHISDLQLKNNRCVVKCPICRQVSVTACVVENRDLKKACEILKKSKVPDDSNKTRSEDICPNHTKQEMRLSMWCIECDKGVCGLCVIGTQVHANHKIIPFNEVEHHVKSSLQFTASEVQLVQTLKCITSDIGVCDFQIVQLNASEKEAAEYFRNEFDNWMQQMQKDFGSAIERISQIYKGKINSVRVDKDRLQCIKSYGEDLKEKVEKLLSTDSSDNIHKFAQVSTSDFAEKLKGFSSSAKQARSTGISKILYDMKPKQVTVAQRTFKERLAAISKANTKMFLSDLKRISVMTQKATSELQSEIEKDLESLTLIETGDFTKRKSGNPIASSSAPPTEEFKKLLTSDFKTTIDASEGSSNKGDYPKAEENGSEQNKITVHCQIAKTKTKVVRRIRMGKYETTERLHSMISDMLIKQSKSKPATSQKQNERPSLKIKHRGMVIPSGNWAICAYGLENNSIINVGLKKLLNASKTKKIFNIAKWKRRESQTNLDESD